MTDSPRDALVLNAVAGFVDSLLGDFDVLDLLTDLTAHCAELLGVAAAGFLLADPWQHLRLLAATSEQAHDLEVFQLQADEGPCVDCYRRGEIVSVADLRTEVDRWPHFVPEAIDNGFVSVHAIPMRAAGVRLGALGLFGSEPEGLGAHDRLVGQTLAQMASVAIVLDHPPTSSSVVTQLRSVLTGRVVVEQAKGFLRGTFDITTDEAFRVLRAYSRDRHEHLTAVARTLMTDRDARPALLDALRERLDVSG